MDRQARWMVRIGWMTAALVVGMTTLPPLRAAAQWKTPWTYEGPLGAEHWSDLDPAYAACNTGKSQSPIDIRNPEKADLPALRFDYHSGPLEFLINNGYTIRVNYHDAAGSGNFLFVGDVRYHLTQFHFHRPSEESIRGKPWAMAVHLMHESSDGKIAGVTVLLQAGKANPTVQQIWDHMPEAKGDEEAIAGVSVNPAGLLPPDRAYYTYTGSITAPPCTEGVTWIVLKTPVEVSPEQISAFSRLYPHDVRPLQPLNGRVVLESR
jgi:carbonic anhydrase